MKLVTLFNNRAPSAEITVIDANLCPKAALLCCGVPDKARKTVPNNTDAICIDENPIFVRGVNSSFYKVEIDKHEYYVHEQYVWAKP